MASSTRRRSLLGTTRLSTTLLALAGGGATVALSPRPTRSLFSARTVRGVGVAEVVGPPPSRSALRVRQRGGEDDDGDVPYLEAAYDPSAAAAFYEKRPLTCLSRVAELSLRWSSFFLNTVVVDRLSPRRNNNNNDDDDAALNERRSRELVTLLTDAGPAFVKVGQALSVRTDLLPPEYTDGLARLQDAVPPFDAAEGRAVVERELGLRSLEDVFSSFDPEPVASASIGQVYKATLRTDGSTVAVKVRRPGVLRNVALDLHLLRRVAPWWQDLKEINTNLTALVDAWGEGFVNELDYRREARSAAAFSEAMRERGLDAVFSPDVVEELSSTRVLTTRWVDGAPLSSSSSSSSRDGDDVPRLCGLALNAYLTMLLDTGTLHCDPHPGNLLRTTDGRLCVLDWGMSQEVPPDLRLSLLEFIADLNAKNYERVPDDLVALRFVPPDRVDDLRRSGLTVAISSMLELAAQGGGPKGAMKRMVQQNKEKYAEALKDFDDLDSTEATKVRQRLFREDWQKSMAEDAARYRGSDGDDATATTTTNISSSTTMDVTRNIEQLQRENADVFAIPDYFLYMARAFATLEGIGLSSNPDYSILQECYPYLAKRLLSDDSPRARGALRTLLYGGDVDDDALLDLGKLRELAEGLESYTVSTTAPAAAATTKAITIRGDGRRSDHDHDSARRTTLSRLADVVLDEDGNYLQDVLLRETAATLDAALRDAASRILSPSSSSLLLPPPPPPVAALLRLDDRERRRLDDARAALTSSSSRGGGVSVDRRALEDLAREAVRRRGALARVAVRFGESAASVRARRLRAAAPDGPIERLVADRLERLAAAARRWDDSTRTTITTTRDGASRGRRRRT